MKRLHQVAVMAMSALLAMENHKNNKNNKSLFATGDELQTNNLFCKDCKFYQHGKTYCKVAKHAIKANTVANRCKHFETWY